MQIPQLGSDISPWGHVRCKLNLACWDTEKKLNYCETAFYIAGKEFISYLCEIQSNLNINIADF